MTSNESTSPRGKFEFPECWSNDVRMSALFAPFRSKSVNPTDWDSKMKFWIKLIDSWCKESKCPVVDVASLKSTFSRKGLVPACLEEVLQHMSSTGILVGKDDFMSMDESWKGWAIKVFVTNPLKWTFNTVKNTVIKSEQKEIYYVHLPAVKFLSEEVQKRICSSKGNIVVYDDLLNCGIEAEHLSLILHWMQKQGLIAVSKVGEETFVKYSKSRGEEVKITETDIGIYSLEKQQHLFEESIKKLETERNAALEETKKHLAAKMKNMAKISLRRKNELERKMEKQAMTLENIQEILHNIEQAKLNAEVVMSYQKGTAILKGIYKEFGLNAENIKDTMEELESVLNRRKEIEEALSKDMDPSTEEDLEKELNDLLLNDAPEVPADSLPTVPEVKKEKRKDPDDLGSRMEALSI